MFTVGKSLTDLFEHTSVKIAIAMIIVSLLLGLREILFYLHNERSKKIWNKNNTDLELKVVDKSIRTRTHENKRVKVFIVFLTYNKKNRTKHMALPVRYFDYDNIFIDDIVNLKYVRNNKKSAYYPIIIVVNKQVRRSFVVNEYPNIQCLREINS